MDVRLGRNGDGVVAAQRILSARRVPIIFCTAYSDPAVIERMNTVGPVGIANKPIERHVLRRLIDAAPA
jgi:AmiR/NasT family two-component response regulator